ncbi:hypothetical protein SAMN05660653_02361 [Desulfonatronum thiosulfatophilum]|uniref:Glycosyl transferase family 2 n=1 Tax=Desulfonatronum thiosulfatophilum TaxID=617002 RepID=A0A1G6DSB3_9BACT|nr:glycosyltransferase family A protein [Desulfonatronum thiosulfatophilum]SDB48016.1 hypothetical protein SAMN05660653_02361 [Desulfonatronum thiosulfatophilum]
MRNTLLRRAKGEKVIFLDDDNVLTPIAFLTYLKHMGCEMLIARIDTTRAFDQPFLPVDLPGKSLVRQGNIDPLCLCLSRELVCVRCRGWESKAGYEADFLNILHFGVGHALCKRRVTSSESMMRVMVLTPKDVTFVRSN